MERFKGTVRLPGDPFELSAVVIVADGRLSISAREHTLGDWPLDGISADVQPDGCHVQVGHEALIVTVPHPVRLADAIGAGRMGPGNESRIRSEAPEPGSRHHERPEPSPHGILSRIPLVWKLTTATALLIAALAIFAPVALVGLLLLVATALLITGAMGFLDPFTAVRLPDLLTPSRLIGLGVAVVVAALVLAVSIA